MFLALAMLHHSISTDCFSCRHFFSLYNLCYVAHAACVHVHSVQWRRDKLANYSDLTPRSGPRQYSPNRAKWQLLALMRFLWTKSNSVCLPQCRHQDLQGPHKLPTKSMWLWGPLKCTISNCNHVHVFLHFGTFGLVVLQLILASKLSELEQFENFSANNQLERKQE